MGFSKLRIPKLCEYCEKPFIAKTVSTRFCSKLCSQKLIKRRKKLDKESEVAQTLLESTSEQIANLQSRPYISVSEASTLFGISRDTVRRLIRSKKISSHNFGERLTRINRMDLEKLFTAVEIPKVKESKLRVNDFEVGNCYSISEVSERYKADPSTVYLVIKKNKIPTKKVGSFVYVPKRLIDEIFDPK